MLHSTASIVEERGVVREGVEGVVEEEEEDESRTVQE